MSVICGLKFGVVQGASKDVLLKEPPQIGGTEAALWGSYRGQAFRDEALLALHLGENVDKTGAYYS